MALYRIHTRPKGGLANAIFSFDYVLEEGVLGVGWQTYSEKSIATWQDYESEAAVQHGSKALSRVRYLKSHVKKDDLIWTRSPSGVYYLAKVDSEWEYLTNDRAKDADIVNVVRCKIMNVGAVDAVPGKVVACFRAKRTIQRINGEDILHYSQVLWNRLSNTDYFNVTPQAARSIFSFVQSGEVEDIIFIYPQMQGWVVVPNSRKGDTMSYEFYLIHRETKERAIVQVKTGNTALNSSDWVNKNMKVFLFQANGIYHGAPNPAVVCLTPHEIENFMRQNSDLLPSCISAWLTGGVSEGAQLVAMKEVL